MWHKPATHTRKQNSTNVKPHSFFSALLVLVAMWSATSHVNAQPKQKRPHFQITTNPLDWANKKANLCTQWLFLPRTALCAGGGLHLWDGTEGNYGIKSISTNFESELRFFPFGGSRQAVKRSHKPEFFKKIRKRCPSLTSLQGWWPDHTPLLSGLYVAPGVSFEKQRLSYTPLFGHYSNEFDYTIRKKSGALTAGYCIHIGPVTLGARAGFSAGKYTWSGPNDIFGDTLYNVQWPIKISLQEHFGFEVGFNF